MRFMVIRKADEQTEAGIFPPNAPQVFEAMGNYMEEMVKAGVFLAAEGLQPSSKGARVVFKDGSPTVVDGPFAETKELVAGWFLIEVRSLDEAIEWTKRWPRLDGDLTVEIRQVHENEDLADVLPPAQREKEDRLRAQAAATQKQ